MGLIKMLGMKKNPFEHYTAETEKDIEKYAIRPPYIETIDERAISLTSFLLFGDRGAGKSATRITLYKRFWERVALNEEQPFMVNFTDYERLQTSFSKGELDDKKIIDEVAFNVLEQLILWLSSLSEEVRDHKINSLNKDQRSLVLALMKGYYFNIPELDRQSSNTQSLESISGTLKEKGSVWAIQNFDAIKRSFSAIVSSWTDSKRDNTKSIEDSADSILRALSGSSSSSSVVLRKVTECITSFGFSGVCILVDKLDETEATNNSAEKTARLIYPILSHIQLLEISGFSWIFFLWKDIKPHFEGSVLNVRLDKIAYSEISWQRSDLHEMLNKRVDFYSNSKISLVDLFSESDQEHERPLNLIKEIVRISNKSPRELVKIMDTVIREHDSRIEDDDEYSDEEVVKLDSTSVEQGLDQYCTTSIGYWYDRKMLQQLYDLNKVVFINSDVQTKFKISSQGAREKIKKWKEAGIVKQDGTVYPANSKGKGQPNYKFKVSDPRVKRIIERGLESPKDLFDLEDN